MFADDTKVYKSINNNEDSEILQNALLFINEVHNNVVLLRRVYK